MVIRVSENQVAGYMNIRISGGFRRRLILKWRGLERKSCQESRVQFDI